MPSEANVFSRSSTFARAPKVGPTTQGTSLGGDLIDNAVRLRRMLQDHVHLELGGDTEHRQNVVGAVAVRQ